MGAVTRWFCLTKASASVGTRRIVLAASTLALGMLGFAAPASGFTETFNFTGAAQTWTVPGAITNATFDLYGAAGGGFPGGTVTAPSLGGQATATIAVTPGASIQVNVGGAGQPTNSASAPSFNGGGVGGVFSWNGGGASDIRIGGTALANRVLVAGGGGGAGDGCFDTVMVGGPGGGLSGLAGANGCRGGMGGGGGTQTAGGSSTVQAGQFGLGGNATEGGNFGGGGGGGWYGGGAGVNTGGGGGGSGYGPTGTTFQTGVRSGDGLVTITYTPTIATLIQSVVDLNLPVGLEASLLTPLTNAQHQLDAGRVARACNQLAAFIGRVKAQSGMKIPATDADDLIAEAKDVRGSLNCGAGLTCAGQRATIVGTGGPDKLMGTKGDDVVAAQGGDDTIVALKGDDLLCGGAGADLLGGQGGDDTLRGGPGKDELRGGGGSNSCRGGDGADSKRRC
jgi:Ca2+-binding RTX toxin-like protein